MKRRRPEKNRNEREVTTNTSEIQIIMSLLKLSTNKLNGQEEMDKFLEV